MPIVFPPIFLPLIIEILIIIIIIECKYLYNVPYTFICIKPLVACKPVAGPLI